MMDKCPKCEGPLQLGQTLDVDDKVIAETITCKRKIPGKKKKGCGYTTHRKIKS